MNTTEAIEAALKGETSDAVIYWDKQDASNEGPAFRRESTQESGALEFLGWAATDGRKYDVIYDGLGSQRVKLGEGYFLGEYFKGRDAAYIGPDSDGVYPILTEA
jgi:hypothetical protein